MKKIFLVVIIFASMLLFFWLSNKEKSLNYDNYEQMELLSQKSSIELEKEGYLDSDIKKIEEFNNHYKNHLTLLNIIENDNLISFGYKNRSLSNEVKNDIVYEENYYTIQDSNLSYASSIMDLTRDKNADRDVGRIIIEFDWSTKPYTQKQYINVKYYNYILEDIYTLLKYENPDDEYGVVYKMCEIEPVNFINQFYTDLSSRKNINQQNYVLRSGVIILDVKSYYVDSIAPLSISSKYVGKSLFGKERILSEQKIINAKNNGTILDFKNIYKY